MRKKLIILRQYYHIQRHQEIVSMKYIKFLKYLYAIVLYPKLILYQLMQHMLQVYVVPLLHLCHFLEPKLNHFSVQPYHFAFPQILISFYPVSIVIISIQITFISIKHGSDHQMIHD